MSKLVQHMSHVHEYRVHRFLTSPIVTGLQWQGEYWKGLIRNGYMLFIERSEKPSMLLDQKTVQIGTLTPGRDHNGNEFWYGTSTVSDREIRTLTRGAALLYLERQAQISPRNRVDYGE